MSRTTKGKLVATVALMLVVLLMVAWAQMPASMAAPAQAPTTPTPVSAAPEDTPAAGQEQAAVVRNSAETDLLYGQVLFQRQCTYCHGLAYTAVAQKTAEGWKSSVQRMIVGFGVSLTAEEQEAVIQYLAETYPKLDGRRLFEARCTFCHGVGWIERRAQKSEKEWQATVEREVQFGVTLTAAQQAELIKYLAETYPADKAPADPASRGSEPLDGAELFQQRCTYCHGLAYTAVAKKTREGWTSSVRRMIGGFGVTLSAEEQESVIQYLAETYPKLDGPALFEARCTFCHGVEWIERRAPKTEKGWKATVEREVRFGVTLSPAEQVELVRYLADTYAE